MTNPRALIGDLLAAVETPMTAAGEGIVYGMHESGRNTLPAACPLIVRHIASKPPVLTEVSHG